MTAVAQVAFPHQANGSLIVVDGRTVGSSLIGQAFSDPKYFWGRPSAAGEDGYDANASAGSNLGPTSQDADRPDHRRRRPPAGRERRRRRSRSTSSRPRRPASTRTSARRRAEYQVARVAAARGMAEDDVRAAVARHTEQPLLGFLGQPRVNVLLLNLDLDGLLAMTDRDAATRFDDPARRPTRCSPGSRLEAATGRGRLRVYLGMAPGVGKTYRMLEEGHRRRRARHGPRRRASSRRTGGRDTRELLDGPRDRAAPPHRVPRRRRRGDGHRRHPRRAARPSRSIDELAHTNVPGSPREKRWQDVERHPRRRASTSSAT